MVYITITLGIIGLAACLLFFGAFKAKRREEDWLYKDDDGVTLLDEEEDNADGN